MSIDAKLVKKLREETDAPMMECKKALVESDGDFDRAKDILREKGQAQAAKRADRSTSEGIALTAISDDGTKVAGLVVECETDFVARNEDFKKLVSDLVGGLMASADASPGETVEVAADTIVNGKSLGDHITDAVAKIRENIRLATAVVARASDGNKLSIYNHTNTGKAASFIEYAGDGADAAFHVAIQVVAFPPNFLTREEVPQDVIAKEIEIEKQRAVNDGKPVDIAEKIALGRVNKEYYQTKVLLDQPLYSNAKMKVGDYAKEAGITVRAYRHLAVGASRADD
ncbi:MAG: translation elongation factor Ts [Armatimonadetes bacterium]|nr:translation elongation factor Ts [Armatimonadota bacterium]